MELDNTRGTVEPFVLAVLEVWHAAFFILIGTSEAIWRNSGLESFNKRRTLDCSWQRGGGGPPECRISARQSS